MQQTSEAELREIGAQLRKPEGLKGMEMAEAMNENNRNMITSTIDAVGMATGNVVLEIGPGNADHVREMVPMDVEYHGIDISPTMVEEARRRLVDRPGVKFHHYPGELLPFPDGMFDRIFTVNTIYFWRDPNDFMEEMHRVLKGDGKAVITFADRSFMEKLPFTKWDFTLYDAASMITLVDRSPLKLVSINGHSEMIKSRTGEMIPRTFTVVVLRRPK